MRDNQWTSEPADAEPARRKRKGKVKPSIQLFHSALVDALAVASIRPGETKLAAWEEECVRRGLLEPSEPGDTGTIRRAKRAMFRTAKSDLQTAGMIGIDGHRVMDLTRSW
jgi:hypothetical protein